MHEHCSWLCAPVLLGMAATLLLLPGSVLGDDPPATAVTARPEVALPPVLTPPTRHEAVVVPAGPEDPAAPARTFEDPPPVRAGDESASRPVPDYLKGSPYRLSFVTGDLLPPPHERIDPRLIEGLGRSGRDATYGYVMFEGELQARKVEALEALGLAFGAYHPFNCLQAWIPAGAIEALRVHPFVRWVGYARPEQKVDEFLLDALTRPGADPAEELAVYVNVFDSDLGPWSRSVPIDAAAPPASPSSRHATMHATVTMSNGPFQRAIEAAGGRVFGYEDSIRTFYVRATRPAIRRLMELDLVAGMDTAHPPEPNLDRSTRMTQADYVGALAASCGQDTSFALVDSGIWTFHRDLDHASVLSWDYSGDNNPMEDHCGHGTHLAGIVYGDGSARTDRRFRGSAPATGTRTQHAVYNCKILTRNCSSGPGWPNYALTAWTQTTKRFSVFSTLTSKCTVVLNGWGSGSRSSTGYWGTDTLSRAADANTHAENQLYVMSASNFGGTSTIQYLSSCLPPGVAKSALTVGNILDHEDRTGTYGKPYVGAQAFSSGKGPTRDARLKPQVSAPGTWIVSAKTDTSADYVRQSGTSMAAAHVAGVACMMHDALTTYRDSPALTRAMIMASAAPFGDARNWVKDSESCYYRRGMGQVDAFAALHQFDNASGWKSGYVSVRLRRSSAGFYFDIPVPADAEKTFFVLSWDEVAPALNSTQAVLYNLDLVLDVEPFDPDINKGEYVSRAKVDNYDWYGHVANIGEVRGKKLRVKVPFLTKPTSSTEEVRIGLAYHIARGDPTPTASLSITATPNPVKPGEPITVTGTAAVNEYRANNVEVYLATAVGFAVTSLSHTTGDGRTLTTEKVACSTDSRAGWTLGEMTYNWLTANRRLTWAMKAPATEGSHPLIIAAVSDTTNTAYANTSVCVDGTSPGPPLKVRSTTHTASAWSNAQAFTVNWVAATDVGCAGMSGYGAGVASACPKIVGRNLGNVTTYSTSFPATAGSSWYFGIRAFDRAGNTSTLTCIGPFRIDTVAPAKGTIAIDGGAASTPDLIVTLDSLGAFDGGSGLDRMRFSNNGKTWSPWEAIAASRAGWDLSSYGGSTSAGVKTVHVQYRDGAGNVSSSFSDTIDYRPLAIKTVSPSRGTLIGDDLVTITGVNFLSGARVYFGTTAASSIVVASSSRITCRTPRHLTWESVDVRVQVDTRSVILRDGYEYVGADILGSGNPKLGTPLAITFNAPVDGGRSYAGAASFGEGPIALPPHNPVPLAPDVLFFLTAYRLLPTVFVNLQGTLDASGQSAGAIQLPNNPPLVGLRFRMAFLTLDGFKPLGVRTVSSGRTFRILAD